MKRKKNSIIYPSFSDPGNAGKEIDDQPGIITASAVIISYETIFYQHKNTPFGIPKGVF